MVTWGEVYLTRLRGCAALVDQELGEIGDRDRSVRLVDSDARTVEEGFDRGVLELDDDGRVRTLDRRQRPVSLLTDDPLQPCWQTLAQLAAYVELLRLGYPGPAVRFATGEDELALDLAAVNENGQVLVLGIARAEALLLSRVEALVPTFEGDGPRPVRSALGCDAHRVATQLWATGAPYLWLTAPGARRAYRVIYGATICLAPVKELPTALELWPYGFVGASPRILDAATAACG